MSARPNRIEKDGVLWVKRATATGVSMTQRELAAWAHGHTTSSLDDELVAGPPPHEPQFSRGVWLEWYSPETEDERVARGHRDSEAEKRRSAHRRRLMRAVLDPGSFTPRGADYDGTPYGESLDSWQERAMTIALHPTREERQA